ncbi:hypothetical protein [Leminorella grimontii]|uniref:hypothetical protein n=1 Tax=Leminorella grimontii TaxID=82981 RepID=UPI0032206CCA
MSNVNLTTLNEEVEEVVGTIGMMTEAVGDNSDDHMYRTLRSLFKKMRAIEVSINELIVDGTMKVGQ